MWYRTSCLQGAVYSLTRFLFCFLSGSTGHMCTMFIPCMLKVRQGQSALCRQRRSTARTNCAFWWLRTELSRLVRAAFYPISTFHMSCFPCQIKHLLVVLQHTQSNISKQSYIQEIAGKPWRTSQTLHYIQICVNIHFHQTWLELVLKWKEICVWRSEVAKLFFFFFSCRSFFFVFSLSIKFWLK